MGPGYFGMGYGMGWIGMWIYPILMIGCVALILYLVFGRKSDRISWSGLNRSPDAPGYPETALELLKKRYAKGEITQDEFKQMKRDLH